MNYQLILVSLFLTILSSCAAHQSVIVNGANADSTQVSIQQITKSLPPAKQREFAMALVRIQLSEFGSVYELIDAGPEMSQINYNVLGEKLDGLSYAEIMELADKSPVKAVESDGT